MGKGRKTKPGEWRVGIPALTEGEKRLINELRWKHGVCLREIGEQFNRTPSAIWRVTTKKKKRDDD